MCLMATQQTSVAFAQLEGKSSGHGPHPELALKRDILSVVKAYTGALDLLDDYDHQRIAKPKGPRGDMTLNYDECRSLIASMKFSRDSDLFGVEGRLLPPRASRDLPGLRRAGDVPTLEEKAANLLYFVVKNHSFHDGNKRIAAALFPVFLEHERCVVGRWRQAYFRQRVGRAHHHDRRVEARRERGYGGIGYELPFLWGSA